MQSARDERYFFDPARIFSVMDISTQKKLGK
jgi:hypothetical protein